MNETYILIILTKIDYSLRSESFPAHLIILNSKKTNILNEPV